jgi:hypothetical protein
MRLMEGVVLGSAVACLASGGVRAADLPVKAQAVEYVRVCSLYGAGFWYIPGTDTCIKIGGFLRIDTTFNASGAYGGPAYLGDIGLGDRFSDLMISRSRLGLTIDTRTATEYGVVRTFAQGDFTFQNFGTTDPVALTAPPSALGGINNAFLSSVGGGYVAVDYVFIQFAGFSIGKSSSAFATPWNGYPGNNTSYLIGGHDTVTGVNNIQYTAQFDHGVSASIGLDDPTQFNRTPLYNLALGIATTGLGVNSYEGWVYPDLVTRFRVEQAWGLFQVSGALHQVGATYNTLGAGGSPTTTSILSGHPDSEVGGAVMAAFQVKNIPTGAGDDIKLDTTWAKGDTKQVISTSATSPSFTMLGGVPGQFGPNNTYGFGATTDGLFMPTSLGHVNGVIGDGKIHLTESWGVRGAFNHNWNPYWSTSLWGGAGWVSYDETARLEYCALFGLTHPGLGVSYSCDPSFSAAMAGVVTRWSPVKNMTFSTEVGWFGLHQRFVGTSTFSPGTITQLYTFHDQDTAYLDVRVQRNF